MPMLMPPQEQLRPLLQMQLPMPPQLPDEEPVVRLEPEVPARSDELPQR